MNEQIDDDDAVLTEAVVTQAPVPVIAVDELDDAFGEDEQLEDLDDDFDGLDVDIAPHPEDPRVAELEAKVDTLAGAAVAGEQRRVRRKVKAATGGAGLVGFIPIALQLLGALELDPEVASAIAASAAAVGALIAGWATPERSSAILAKVVRTTQEIP
jgi:hypothetical protein